MYEERGPTWTPEQKWGDKWGSAGSRLLQGEVPSSKRRWCPCSWTSGPVRGPLRGLRFEARPFQSCPSLYPAGALCLCLSVSVSLSLPLRPLSPSAAPPVSVNIPLPLGTEPQRRPFEWELWEARAPRQGPGPGLYSFPWLINSECHGPGNAVAEGLEARAEGPRADRTSRAGVGVSSLGGLSHSWDARPGSVGSAGSAGQTFVYTCWPLWAVGTAPGARQLWGHSAGPSKLAPPMRWGAGLREGWAQPLESGRPGSCPAGSFK